MATIRETKPGLSPGNETAGVEVEAAAAWRCPGSIQRGEFGGKGTFSRESVFYNIICSLFDLLSRIVCKRIISQWYLVGVDFLVEKEENCWALLQGKCRKKTRCSHLHRHYLYKYHHLFHSEIHKNICKGINSMPSEGLKYNVSRIGDFCTNSDGMISNRMKAHSSWNSKIHFIWEKNSGDFHYKFSFVQSSVFWLMLAVGPYLRLV